MYLAKGFVLCLFLALGSFADQECKESDWSPCCLPCGKQIQPFSHRIECIHGQGIWKFKPCSDSISSWSNWENCSSNVCNEEGIQTRKRVACEGVFEELESQTCIPDQDNCITDGCDPIDPINCQDDEKTCPGGTLPDGCPLPDQCIPKELTFGCENPCPMPSCPPPSKGCTVFDQFECPLDPYCVDPEFGTNGEPCLSFCPPICYGGPTCPGEKDPNGCKVTPDTCAPGMYFVRFCCQRIKFIQRTLSPIVTKGTDGEDCPIVCDPNGPPCPEGQTKCPGQTDSNNCPLPAVCVETLFDNNGNDCTPSQLCPFKCDDGQKTCPGGVFPNGCPRNDQCQPELTATGCDNPCPCPPPSKDCPGGFDETTECPLEPFCLDLANPELGNNGEPCPGFCPTICPPGVPTCPGEIDPNGCKVTPDTCGCAAGMYFVVR